MDNRRTTSCVIFWGSLILYAIYFAYELLIQNDLRFPRDEDEASDIYDGISSSGEKGIRYCEFWWLFQSHHLYGLGVALLGIVYLSAVEFQQGTAFGCLCSIYFGIVSFLLWFATGWWFWNCNSRTANADCFALRERAHGTTVDDSLRFWIPFLYILMAVISLSSFLTCWYLFREVDRKEERLQRSASKRQSKQGSSRTRTGGYEQLPDTDDAEGRGFSIFSSKSSFAQRLLEKTDKNIKNL